MRVAGRHNAEKMIKTPRPFSPPKGVTGSKTECHVAKRNVHWVLLTLGFSDMNDPEAVLKEMVHKWHTKANVEFYYTVRASAKAAKSGE